MEKSNFRLNWIPKNLFFRLSVALIGLPFLAFPGINEKPDPADFNNLINLREKTYLHIDKTTYNAGEDLWFKVYLVDASTLRPDASSKIVYVDLIDPDNKIIASRIIKINEGCGDGDFKLPADLINGEYIVRAYTRFMQNFDKAWFFRKKIVVRSARSNRIANEDSTQNMIAEGNIDHAMTVQKPDVQFFPEGGYLVDDLLNHVGIKAVGTDGKGVDISGIIADNSGEQVKDFKTTKFGLGMFDFVPRKGKRYKAFITVNGVEYPYDLPVSLSNGVVMQVIAQNDFYTIIIRSSLPNGVNNFKFNGRQRNRIIGSSEILSGIDGAKIKIPKNILEQGIAQFTLFDNNGAPLCERLVFVEKNDTIPTVNISASKKEYGKRELVELEISPDQGAIPSKINSNMSVAVTDLLVAGRDRYGLDIRSYLLLNSDLRGEIEQPGYYFNSDDPQRKNVLDLLMMTQGWRQYVLNDTLNRNSIKFPCETGIRFGGSVKRFNDQGKPAKASVSLTYDNKEEMVYYETETDDLGHFVFEDFNFIDSTSVIIQAKKLKKGEKEDISMPNPNFYIVMDSLAAPKPAINKISANQSSNAIANTGSDADPITKGEPDDRFQVQKGDILIDEVIVSAKKIDRLREKRSQSFYFEPSNHLDFEEIKGVGGYKNAFDAIDGRIPGVQVVGDKIIIRGYLSISQAKSDEGDPLFLLDGIPVAKDVILSFPVTNIDFIDVLKGAKANIYGSSGAHGVIAVYTLNASDILNKTKEKERTCIVNFIHPGYNQPRKFYEPVYLSGASDQNKPDNRSTIYWNPLLKSDGQEKIRISFYTADIPTTYRVKLEGITTEGVPIQSELFFEVK